LPSVRHCDYGRPWTCHCSPRLVTRHTFGDTCTVRSCSLIIHVVSSPRHGGRNIYGQPRSSALRVKKLPRGGDERCRGVPISGKQHQGATASCRSPARAHSFPILSPDGAHFKHLSSGAAKAFTSSRSPSLFERQKYLCSLDYEYL